MEKTDNRGKAQQQQQQHRILRTFNFVELGWMHVLVFCVLLFSFHSMRLHLCAHANDVACVYFLLSSRPLKNTIFLHIQMMTSDKSIKMMCLTHHIFHHCHSMRRGRADLFTVLGDYSAHQCSQQTTCFLWNENVFCLFCVAKFVCRKICTISSGRIEIGPYYKVWF